MFGTNTMNRGPEYQIDRKIKIYNNFLKKGVAIVRGVSYNTTRSAGKQRWCSSVGRARHW